MDKRFLTSTHDVPGKQGKKLVIPQNVTSDECATRRDRRAWMAPPDGYPLDIGTDAFVLAMRIRRRPGAFDSRWDPHNWPNGGSGGWFSVHSVSRFAIEELQKQGGLGPDGTILHLGHIIQRDLRMAIDEFAPRVCLRQWQCWVDNETFIQMLTRRAQIDGWTSVCFEGALRDIVLYELISIFLMPRPDDAPRMDVEIKKSLVRVTSFGPHNMPLWAMPSAEQKSAAGPSQHAIPVHASTSFSGAATVYLPGASTTECAVAVENGILLVYNRAAKANRGNLGFSTHYYDTRAERPFREGAGLDHFSQALNDRWGLALRVRQEMRRDPTHTPDPHSILDRMLTGAIDMDAEVLETALSEISRGSTNDKPVGKYHTAKRSE